MQNYLFSDAIAKVLKSYDSDFFIEMSDAPDKTAELCRVIQPHILMMEITGQALWSLKERLAICREVRRYAPNCKFIFTAVSYTHLRAHETDSYLVCRLLLEKKKRRKTKKKKKHH